MRKTTAAAFFAAAALLCAPASAAVYQCLKNGEWVYTNKAGPNCKTQNLAQIGSYSSVHRETAAPRKSAAGRRSSGSNAAVPYSVSSQQRIDSKIQQQRDGSRLSILQRELANEERALLQAQKALSDHKPAGSDDARLNALKGAVTDRQENINALKKEISRM